MELRACVLSVFNNILREPNQHVINKNMMKIDLLM